MLFLFQFLQLLFSSLHTLTQSISISVGLQQQNSRMSVGIVVIVLRPLSRRLWRIGKRQVNCRPLRARTVWDPGRGRGAAMLTRSVLFSASLNKLIANCTVLVLLNLYRRYNEVMFSTLLLVCLSLSSNRPTQKSRGRISMKFLEGWDVWLTTSSQRRRFWGFWSLNALKICMSCQSMFWPPPLKMSHSFIQNCCWITLQVSRHQGWKTRVVLGLGWPAGWVGLGRE